MVTIPNADVGFSVFLDGVKSVGYGVGDRNGAEWWFAEGEVGNFMR